MDKKCSCSTFIGIILLSGLSTLNADVIVEKVIHHNLYSSLDIGNLLGIAYNSESQHIYLSHGSDWRGGFIHTIDFNGNLLNTWGVTTNKGSYCYPTSISYEKDSEHLFIQQSINLGDEIPLPSRWENHILEISVDGVATYNDFNITDTNYIAGGDGLFVDQDGIWLTSFANNSLTHLALNGQFLKQFSVDTYVPVGPYGIMDLCASFDNGFFLLYDYGKRIVEIDKEGKYIGELSTVDIPLWGEAAWP